MAWQQPDSLRTVLDSVFAAPKYQWSERPAPLALLRRWWGALTQWLDTLQDRHPVGFELLVFALITVLVIALVHAGWLFARTMRRAEGQPSRPSPGTVRRDQEWYRREADRLALEGRFADAMQADFLALVLALDARALLRFHPSKTPGEYVGDAQLAPESRTEFRELVHRLYGYAFARWPCGAGEFAEWRAHAAPERYASPH